ncbi:MAG: hypothetical protein M1284_03385 [Candidatus Parvarchaeota archaeon]|jgi:hypothetical protein|nr:hypothetical protein [Candidatus Parvarchaeota archaeon]
MDKHFDTKLLLVVLIPLLLIFIYGYVEVIHDALSSMIIMYEFLVFLILIVIYSKHSSEKNTEIVIAIMSVLSVATILLTYTSPAPLNLPNNFFIQNFYNHADVRLLLLVGMFFLNMYLTVLNAFKGKIPYKVLSIALFISLIFISFFIVYFGTFAGYNGDIYAQLLPYIWNSSFKYIFNVPFS